MIAAEWEWGVRIEEVRWKEREREKSKVS